MKKFTTLFLIVILVFSLCACDSILRGNEPAPRQTETPDATETTSDILNTATPDVTPPDANSFDTSLPAELTSIDPSNYTVTVDTSISDRITKNYVRKEYITYDLQNKIKIEETEITLLSDTVEDVLNAGWKIIGGHDADDMIRKNTATNARFQNADGKTVTIYAASKKDAETKFSQCVITDIQIRYSSFGYVSSVTNDNADFNIYTSLNNSSTCFDVIKVLGEPNVFSVTDMNSGGSLISLIYSNSMSSKRIYFAFYKKDGQLLLENFDMNFN